MHIHIQLLPHPKLLRYHWLSFLIKLRMSSEMTQHARMAAACICQNERRSSRPCGACCEGWSFVLSGACVSVIDVGRKRRLPIGRGEVHPGLSVSG